MRKKIPLQHLIIFFRQLAVLIKAKIPLLQSCHMLLQSEKNHSLRWILQVIKNDIESGHGLAKGLQKFPTVFNHLVCHLIETGEQTGTLDRTLYLVIVLLEKSLKTRNQIKQALFYPITVLVIAVLVSLMMLIFIVPRFAEFFQGMHGQLPLFTQIIIHLSLFIRKNYAYLLFFVIVTLIGFNLLRSTDRFKKPLNQWIVRLPFVRQFLSKLFVLHFARHLAIVYAAGVTIPDGLNIVARSYHHTEFIEAVKKIRNGVMTGQQLNVSMRSCPLFPPIIIHMIQIGEDTGELQPMLETVVDLYENNIDQLSIRMNQSLEPLIMIILGILIGGLIIAMYLPIFNLGML